MWFGLVEEEIKVGFESVRNRWRSNLHWNIRTRDSSALSDLLAKNSVFIKPWVASSLCDWLHCDYSSILSHGIIIAMPFYINHAFKLNACYLWFILYHDRLHRSRAIRRIYRFTMPKCTVNNGTLLCETSINSPIVGNLFHFSWNHIITFFLYLGMSFPLQK